MEYPKIQSLFKRDPKGKFIIDDWSLPEFEYLKFNRWEWTEKIDGMNIRVIWDGKNVVFRGRTDRAQLPDDLVDHLTKTFTINKMIHAFGFNYATPDVKIYLFGEGFGAGIQKGGKYGADKRFILFDVLVGRWWLKRDALEDCAHVFGIPIVPVVGYGTIGMAIGTIENGLKSIFGDFQAEGLVLKPAIELHARNGNRIITKVKHKDFIF